MRVVGGCYNCKQSIISTSPTRGLGNGALLSTRSPHYSVIYTFETLQSIFEFHFVPGGARVVRTRRNLTFGPLPLVGKRNHLGRYMPILDRSGRRGMLRGDPRPGLGHRDARGGSSHVSSWRWTGS